MSEFILGDCLEYMRKMPDKSYDLAIVDPPYGDGLHAEDGGGKGWFTKYNMKLRTQDDAEQEDTVMSAEREREREKALVKIRTAVRPLQATSTRVGSAGAVGMGNGNTATSCF